MPGTDRETFQSSNFRPYRVVAQLSADTEMEAGKTISEQVVASLACP
jgi:hypothetical protein